MHNIDAWLDVWRGGLVFSFVGIHIVDSGASSALCGKMAHLSTVKAWPFRFVWLVCPGCMDFILGCIIFIVLGSIGSWLVWSIVELVVVPIVEAIVRESGMSYVHWDWCIAVLPGCIR